MINKRLKARKAPKSQAHWARFERKVSEIWFLNLTHASRPIEPAPKRHSNHFIYHFCSSLSQPKSAEKRKLQLKSLSLSLLASRISFKVSEFSISRICCQFVCCVQVPRFCFCHLRNNFQICRWKLELASREIAYQLSWIGGEEGQQQQLAIKWPSWTQKEAPGEEEEVEMLQVDSLVSFLVLSEFRISATCKNGRLFSLVHKQKWLDCNNNENKLACEMLYANYRSFGDL